MLLEPFTGFVPTSEFAHRVVGPPVSMLSPDQREQARVDPLSFRHVVGRGAGSSNQEAREWLRACDAADALHAIGPMVAVYQLAKGDLVATGVIADVSIAAYDEGRIKPHEKTIAKTQERMAEYMRTTRIFGNPVALAHRPHAGISEAIAGQLRRKADYSFVAADGFSHAMWAIRGAAAYELCAAFDDELYITDGHHRLAAASMVAAEEGRVDPHLPAGLFSMSELRLASFARCVEDPTLDLVMVTEQLRSTLRLEEVGEFEARPRGRFEFGVKIGDSSYLLQVDPELIPDDVYGALDVNLLQDLILGPIFEITDPSRDDRLRFIADIHAANTPLRDCSAWFLPFPSSIHDVMAVADLGRTMPPKSTWFAPKLPSGLVIRLLDK